MVGMASGSSTSVAGGSTETVLVTSAPGVHARTTGQVVISPIQAMIDKAVNSSISSLSSSIERMVQEAVRINSPSGTRVIDTAIQGGSVSGGRSGAGIRAPIPSVVPLGELSIKCSVGRGPGASPSCRDREYKSEDTGGEFRYPYGINNPYARDGFVIISIGEA